MDIVNRETGRGSNKDRKIILNTDRCSCSNPYDIAKNAFAQYFSSIANLTLERTFGSPQVEICTTSPIHPETFFFYPVDGFEVLSSVTSLKNKKSVGFHFISTRVMKSISEYIKDHSAHLIIMFQLVQEFFLKRATVLPVLKKNDTTDIANYRPISLLSVLSKIMEKIVLNTIFN